MPNLAADTLRHWVELQRPVIAQDATTGEQLVTWSQVARLWADIHPQSGHEFVAAGAEQSEVRTRIMMRYSMPVTADMRVVHAGEYFAIFAVLPDDDSGREHLTLMCGAGVRLDQ